MEILIIAVILLIAISVHEFSHAFVAYLLGDSTAKKEGRMTLNPLAHLDPAGTILFFLVHFGWGKPVPVNPRNFKRPRFHNLLVSLAGPFSNLLMSLLGILLIKYASLSGNVLNFVALFTIVNTYLMIFNLIPIPPLDGSHILPLITPKPFQKYLPTIYLYAPAILLGLVLLEFVFPEHISILSYVLGELAGLVHVFLYEIS